LSICSSHWSPWIGPTGINSLPPGFSWCIRASGIGCAAAPTCIASYGASERDQRLLGSFVLKVTAVSIDTLDP